MCSERIISTLTNFIKGFIKVFRTIYYGLDSGARVGKSRQWIRRSLWIGRFPVQTPLGARLGLGTHRRYVAGGAFWSKSEKRTVINIGWVRLYPRLWPKVDRMAAKQQFKIYKLFALNIWNCLQLPCLLYCVLINRDICFL